MALHPIHRFDPNYRDYFGGRAIQRFKLYSGDDAIGSVDDLLVDDSGSPRYFVVHTSEWISGKKVLLPIALTHIDDATDRVYVKQFTKEHVAALPEFTSETAADLDYEKQLRQVYRSASVPAAYGVGYAGYESAPATPTDPPPSYGVGHAGYDDAPAAPSAPVPAGYGVGYTGYASAPETPADPPPSYGVGHAGYDDAAVTPASGMKTTAGDRDSDDYLQDPALYELNEHDHRSLKRYEDQRTARRPH